MGLYIISGTMGGGKSYLAAQLAFECWRDGGIVHSNMPWNFEEIDSLGFTSQHITLPESHEQWVRTELGPDGKERVASEVLIGGAEGHENLIIIDEAALQLSAMDQAETKKKNRTLFRLVVMSRQLGLDMYFVSQSTTNLDVFIRNVAESIIHCQNVKRIPGIGAVLAFFVGAFRRTWLSPQQRKPLMTRYARFNPAIGALYKTHGEGDKMGVKRAERLRKKRGGNWQWKHVLYFGSAISLGWYCWKNWKGSPFEIPGVNAPPVTGLVPAHAAANVQAPPRLPDPPPLRLVMRSADNSSALDSEGTLYQMNAGSGTRRIIKAIDTGSVLTLHLIGGRVVNLQYD
ncbi:MAG: hypothetical protein J0L73_23520 [Verrucomicrobia bacterium]|nr:hypothetical protein [Verrucomicrobiota bacterium]